MSSLALTYIYMWCMIQNAGNGKFPINHTYTFKQTQLTGVGAAVGARVGAGVGWAVGAFTIKTTTGSAPSLRTLIHGNLPVYMYVWIQIQNVTKLTGVGTGVGARVGAAVGEAVGARVGAGVGSAVGAFKTNRRMCQQICR